jgi:tetratricopeptide (TPR) repeat protein
MLDTVRRFGLERLERNGNLDRIAAAHARWVLEQTERASRGLSGAEEASSAETIRRSVDELRAAHRWLVAHDLDAALRLAAALRPYALWRGHSEIFRWAEVVAAAASGSGGPLLAEVLLAASTGAWQRGDLAGASAVAEAIPGCGPFQETRRAALEASADVALLRGDLVRAEEEFTDAYRLALEASDMLQAVWDIASAAVAVAYGGNLARALHLAHETSAAAERSGSPSARAMAEFVLGELLAREEPDIAERHLRRAIEYSAIADSRFVAGIAEVALAASRSRQRDIAVALEHSRSAIERWRQAGAWTPLWVTIRTVVALLVRAGELDDAAVLLGAAESARSGAPSFGSDAEAMLTAEQHLRSALGDEAFADLTASARAMTEDEVLQYAILALDRAATHVT